MINKPERILHVDDEPAIQNRTKRLAHRQLEVEGRTATVRGQITHGAVYRLDHHAFQMPPALATAAGAHTKLRSIGGRYTLDRIRGARLQKF